MSGPARLPDPPWPVELTTGHRLLPGTVTLSPARGHAAQALTASLHRPSISSKAASAASLDDDDVLADSTIAAALHTLLSGGDTPPLLTAGDTWAIVRARVAALVRDAGPALEAIPQADVDATAAISAAIANRLTEHAGLPPVRSSLLWRGTWLLLLFCFDN